MTLSYFKVDLKFPGILTNTLQEFNDGQHVTSGEQHSIWEVISDVHWPVQCL